ncbi:MAG: hypothetical protein PUB84_08430 [Bacteroidales bacterium]|nr:hypothetical protein [Bacteroidales bacterium]MDD6538762.1 hypothetical protein [Bacteroidales bacterium]MDD6555330.1 hypothetical protein [Bacteroidales bacterium]
MKRYIKPASELIDLEMGVMIAASDTTLRLDNTEGNKGDAGVARSPIWRHMDSSNDSRLF